MGIAAGWRQRPRSHKVGIVLLVLYVLYALVGYFIGSPLLRSSMLLAP